MAVNTSLSRTRASDRARGPEYTGGIAEGSAARAPLGFLACLGSPSDLVLRWAVATLVAGVAFSSVFVVDDCRENGASVCVCARCIRDEYSHKYFCLYLLA